MERFCRPVIKKYASELDVETMSDPVVPLEDQDGVAADKKESDYKPKACVGKIATWYNRCDIRDRTRERRPFPSLS